MWGRVFNALLTISVLLLVRHCGTDAVAESLVPNVGGQVGAEKNNVPQNFEFFRGRNLLEIIS